MTAWGFAFALLAVGFIGTAGVLDERKWVRRASSAFVVLGTIGLLAWVLTV